MSRLLITPEARADLADILSTIAKESSRAAVPMNDRFTRRFREIASSPEFGRFVEELPPGTRRVNEGVYAIFFREADDKVQILRVIHWMRDLPARFRD